MTDRELRERARAVIPGGMYGHQAAPGPAYPQFMRGGRGARVWDVDGNEYVDLMCSYGPVVLGHQHPAVEAAAARQSRLGDCQNAPGPVMVDLAELLVRTVFRGGAQQIFVTGSFWFSAVPMAAAVATIGVLHDEGAIETMHHLGAQLRDGILAQARSWDLAVNYTGPPAMPYLTFAGDQDHELAGVFAAQALRGGAWLHPRHNWFVSAALTGDDLALVLAATDQAFAAVRKHLAD
jgi:glutamate-1-semialdehyde aminotransferase